MILKYRERNLIFLSMHTCTRYLLDSFGPHSSCQRLYESVNSSTGPSVWGFKIQNGDADVCGHYKFKVAALTFSYKFKMAALTLEDDVIELMRD